MMPSTAQCTIPIPNYEMSLNSNNTCLFIVQDNHIQNMQENLTQVKC